MVSQRPQRLEEATVGHVATHPEHVWRAQQAHTQAGGNDHGTESVPEQEPDHVEPLYARAGNEAHMRRRSTIQQGTWGGVHLPSMQPVQHGRLGHELQRMGERKGEV